MTKRVLPLHVSAFTDRHGRVRYRHRAAGQPTRSFTAEIGTPEWSEEYRRFEQGAAVPARINRRFPPGTLDDLCARYYRSLDFTGQSEESQARNRAIIEGFRGGRGDRRVSDVTFEHLEAIFARKAKRISEPGKRPIGGTAAAQALRKQLRRLFAHAVRVGMIRVNPIDDTRQVRHQVTGFHSWTEEEIAQYRHHHPLGTKARLALEIILWTAQRRSDAHRFGPREVKGSRITFTQAKTGKTLVLPMAPPLADAIAAMPSVGLKTYLVTEYGKPFTKEGFGNKMRQWCDEAGLPHCSAHGLRKAIARRLADNGEGNQGIKSVGGWKDDREVATYVAGANQQRLADHAIGGLVEWELANPTSPKLANPE